MHGRVYLTQDVSLRKKVNKNQDTIAQTFKRAVGSGKSDL